MTCSSDLRHRVALQSKSRVSDSGGGSSGSWSTDETIWAKIMPTRGREGLHAEHIQDSITHEVTIRYRSDLAGTVGGAFRLLFGTRALNIRAVLNIDERNHWMKLMCEEGVAT